MGTLPEWIRQESNERMRIAGCAVRHATGSLADVFVAGTDIGKQRTLANDLDDLEDMITVIRHSLRTE
jgi:hypothetical protein